MNTLNNKNYAVIGLGLNSGAEEDIDRLIKITNLLLCLFSGQSDDNNCYDNNAICELFREINNKLGHIRKQVYALPETTAYSLKEGKLSHIISTSNFDNKKASTQLDASN